MSELEQAIQEIEVYGFTLLVGVLTPDEVSGMREALIRCEREVGTEIDRYISWPGQALAYKLGELTIRRVRDKAETELGSSFDIRKFHDVVLSLGSVPLPALEARIDAFIADGGQGLPGVTYD